jgi:hypothetical protein
MNSVRQVDMREAICPRPVEMQVPVLGLSRTSTMSQYSHFSPPINSLLRADISNDDRFEPFGLQMLSYDGNKSK